MTGNSTALSAPCIAAALLLLTGCGSRSALEESPPVAGDPRRCNELFVNDATWPQLSVAATSNGFFLAGSFDGAIQFGSYTLTTEDRTLFVARLDMACDVMWARRFSAETYLADVAATSDGGVVVSGHSIVSGVDFGDGPKAGSGGIDVFVVKLDAEGNPLWSRLVSGTHGQYITTRRGSSIAVDAEDGVVLAGSFDVTTDCGGGPLKSGADDAEAAFVARYDAGGAHVWSRAIAATEGDITAERVALDPTGTILFAGDLRGSTELFGAALDSSPSQVRAFVAKLNAAGQPITASLLPAPALDSASQVVEAMALDSSNGAFLVTANYNDGSVVDAKQVMHLDGNAEASWVQELPFFDNGSMHSVLVADGGGGAWYVDSCHSGVCGISNGNGQGSNLPHSYVKAERFDASGAVTWSAQWGSASAWAYGHAATVDAHGKLVLGGQLSGTIDFGAGPIIVPESGAPFGPDDLFLVRLP